MQFAKPQLKAEAALFERDRDLLSIAACGIKQAIEALDKARDHDADIALLEDQLEIVKDAHRAHVEALALP